MSIKNHVSLTGNVGNKPELFTSEAGKNITKMSLATNETYKNEKGEKVTTTEWHNLVLFGNRAKLAAKYLNTGSLISVHGSLRTRKYDDKQGVTKYITEIVVEDLLFLDNKPT